MAVMVGAAGIWVQARRAATERDFALAQMARAAAVSDMNAFLLSDAAPLGRSFTAGDLLTRAEALINRQATDSPDAIAVESLVSIGSQFQAQDEDGNARRVLTRAFDLAQRLPASDVATRAQAGCALANTLARGDHADLQRAQQLVQASLALLPDSKPLALQRAFCARNAGSVARHAGDGAADVAYHLTAQRVLRESGLGSELAHLSVAMELAEAYRGAGRHVEADGAFRVVFARLAQLGRDHTEQAGTLLNNWALSLFFLGRPIDAEAAFRRAIDISRSDGHDGSVSPMLLLNLARPVLELDRADEAATLAERAAAEATRLDDQVVQIQALLFSGGVRRARGDLGGASTAFAEAERRLRERLPAGHVAFGLLALQRALLAHVEGRLGDARDHAQQAIAIAEASSQGGDVLGPAFACRAEVAVAEGRFEAALDDAERALEIERARIGTGHYGSRVGRVTVIVAQAQLGLARRADARASLTEALAHLTATLGADHVETMRARELLAAAVEG